VVASFGVVLFDINLGAVKLVLTLQRVRARSNGAFRAVNYGTRPLGALLGGFLGGAIGLRPTLWIAVAGGCTAFLWLLFSPIRQIRDLPQPVDREV
jgi:predicted MFS family arabinose efflux permease